MRLPSSPDAPKNRTDQPASVNRDPSYPDRARIDSDVRAFLRPTSSPWIVFDRDSRCDDFARSALRVGAVFASSPSLKDEVVSSVPTGGPIVSSREAREPMAGPILSPYAALHTPADAFAATTEAPSVRPMFPPSAPNPDPVVEPSSLVVSSDLGPASEGPRPAEPSAIALPPGLVGGRRRVAWVAGTMAGVVALAAAAALVVGARAQVKHAVKTAKLPPVAAVQAAAPPPAPPAPLPVATEAPALELDALPPPAAAPEAPPAAETAEPNPEKIADKSAAKAADKPDPKNRFGRLTIKADAKVKNVWFDGKRMLGTGQRSFLVFCGMHTIAVNEKTDNRDIEIPCNGEYTVSR